MKPQDHRCISRSLSTALLAFTAALSIGSALAAEGSACGPDSPPAVLRHASTFDDAGPVAARAISGSWEQAYAYDGSSWMSGLRTLVEPTSKLSLSTEVKRKGSGSLLAQVGTAPCDRNAPMGYGQRYRAEAEIMHGRINYPWDDGKSYWVGFSVKPTVAPAAVWSFFQIHAPVNKGVKGPTSNAITIGPIVRDGQPYYRLNVVDGVNMSMLADPKPCALCGTTEVWSAPMPLNKWADFVVNFSLSSEGKGYVHFWYNGQKVYSKTGMTNVQHLDATGTPYVLRTSLPSRVGIYGPACGTPDPFREAYFDEFREAVGCNGYKLVDPAQ
jgi:hypothetical protein